MKKVKLIGASVVALALMLGSCTMQKRHYMAGYHMEWKHGKNETTVAKNDKASKKVADAIAVAAVKTATELASVMEETPVVTASQEMDMPVSAKTMVSSGKKEKSVLRNVAVEKLSLKEKVAIVKAANKVKKAAKKSSEPSKGLYIVLAIFIPFVAVGLATDWDTPTWWNLLWCLLCGIPGIIHAFIVLSREGKI